MAETEPLPLCKCGNIRPANREMCGKCRRKRESAKKNMETGEKYQENPTRCLCGNIAKKGRVLCSACHRDPERLADTLGREAVDDTKRPPKAKIATCRCGYAAFPGPDLCNTCKAKRDQNRAKGLCICGNTPSPKDWYCKKCRPGKKRVRATPKVQRSRTKPKRPSKKALLLEKLNFTSYAEYLESDLWKGIRGRVLDKSSECIKCGHEANQVHHSVYTLRNLSGDSLEGLHPVCQSCHFRAEFDKNKNKLPLSAANRRLGIKTLTDVRSIPRSVREKFSSVGESI